MNFLNSTAYTLNETGTSTDRLNYLLKIKDFLINISDYTLILYDTSNSEHYLVLQRRDEFYHFKTYTGTSLQGIKFFCSYGYDTGVSFESQSSETLEILTIPLDLNIDQYYFYDNGKNTIFVTEYQLGYYSFLNFGITTSLGSQKNLFAISNLSTLANTIGNVDSNYIAFLYDYNSFNTIIYFINEIEINKSYLKSNVFSTNIDSINTNFLSNSKIKLNEKGLLFTPIMYEKAGSLHKPQLEFSDVFLAASDFYEIAEEFTIGSRDFISFPMYQKTIPSNYNDIKSRGLCLIVRTL